MTYDTFHEGFDRIHLVYQKSALSDTGVTTTIPYPVSTSLEKQFPEVEDACGFLFYEQEVTVDDGAIRQLYEINADSCFMHMFGIQVLSGSIDFLECGRADSTDRACGPRNFSVRKIRSGRRSNCMVPLKPYVRSSTDGTVIPIYLFLF